MSWRMLRAGDHGSQSWVHWHNTSRLHGYLNDIPPAEFEATFYATKRTDPTLVEILLPPSEPGRFTACSPPLARQSTPLWIVVRECIVERVWDGSAEPIAQAIHERWRSEQIGAGKPAPSWRELDESRKESSRDQARDIPVKLRMIGCDIAPLCERAANDFTFTDEEVEILAEAEHVRWMRERVADGWTAGDKDVTRKTTPYLVDFEELPADIAEFDRIFVREIPRLLVSVGLQVVRTPTTPQQTGGDQPA